MQRPIKSKESGFTLIELAIVLAIAGLLFLGLWRLLAGGNTQLRDQSAAAQQQQLIGAVKAFLASSAGQSYLTANPNCTGATTTAPNKTCAASSNFALDLPTVTPDGVGNTACIASYTANSTEATFCNFLSPGFSNVTANSYGQTYSIRVLRDGTAAGTAPTTYSFLILASGGDIIPDTSGGRITAIIGGDGGFIYSSNVCNSQTGVATNVSACGAYGTWAIGTSVYGFSASGGYSGSIATRSFLSPEQDATYPWLARVPMAGDSPTTPSFNTMSTNFFLGGQTMYMGSDSTLTTGGLNSAAGAAVEMQGGKLDLENGALVNTGSINGSANMDDVLLSMPDITAATVTAGLTLYGNMVGTGTGPLGTGPFNNPGSVLTVTGTCSKSTTNNAASYLTTPVKYYTQPNGSIVNNCSDVLSITGDVTVLGLLNSYNLYAGTFIYQSSDIRTKTDVQPLGGSLPNIMKLKPVSFSLKVNGQEGMGFIAQDIEKVYPQLISPSGGTKYVNYDGLIGPLVKAVQELKQDNDALREELKVQKERQKMLEHELQK